MLQEASHLLLKQSFSLRDRFRAQRWEVSELFKIAQQMQPAGKQS